MALAKPYAAPWKATAAVAMVQCAPERRRNGPCPRADFDSAAVRIVSHHHADRVAREPSGRFRGDVRTAIELGLTVRRRVR